MAEGVAATLGHVASSGGTNVHGDMVSPNAVEAMAEIGIDISENVPKRAEIFDAGDFDRVISMGCGAKCPTIPIDEDWEVDDPYNEDLDTFRETLMQIRRLVSAIPLQVQISEK
jgi:arsenate reductase